MKDKIVIGYATNRSKDFQQTFNKHLLDSVGLTKEHVAIIPYYNDGFLSLTETYNDLWACASIFKNAVFVFIHHDIVFKSNNWGKTLLDLFNHHTIDIVGVAGTEMLYEHGAWWLMPNGDFNVQDLWGRIWHTHPQRGEFVLDYTTANKSCQTLQPVVTIDGLFIAFNPDTCSEFDEDFDNFHFYDTSFCIKNFLQGKNIAVTEIIHICHESEGKTNPIWNQNRLKFCEKYAAYLPISIQQRLNSKRN